MHPFTPIPLLLSGQYCLSHIGTNDAYANLFMSITRSLEGLTIVNRLAQHSLRTFGVMVPHASVGM